MPERLRRFFNKTGLEYILIIYYVRSKQPVANCFGIFYRIFIWHLTELHHSIVGVGYYIVTCTCLENVIDVFTNWRYCALLLRLLKLNLIVFRSSSAGRKRCFKKLEQPNSGSFVYQIRTTWQFKCRRISENRNQVDWNDNLRPNFYL